MTGPWVSSRATPASARVGNASLTWQARTSASGPVTSLASRFWSFQWIEGGWLLALSLLLIAATVWLVRRRAAGCIQPAAKPEVCQMAGQLTPKWRKRDAHEHDLGETTARRAAARPAATRCCGPPGSSSATTPDPAGTRSPAGAAPTPSTSSRSWPTPPAQAGSAGRGALRPAWCFTKRGEWQVARSDRQPQPPGLCPRSSPCRLAWIQIFCRVGVSNSWWPFVAMVSGAEGAALKGASHVHRYCLPRHHRQARSLPTDQNAAAGHRFGRCAGRRGHDGRCGCPAGRRGPAGCARQDPASVFRPASLSSQQ